MKAIVYTRVSTMSQGDAGSSSLESQAASCRAYAKENNLTVVDTIEDRYSGAYLHDRPGLNRLRDGVRLGLYDAVIAHAVDRLSRSVSHLMIIIDEFERYNVELRFVTEALDATPEGKLLQSVKGYVAEVEREKIRERTMRGRRTHAIQGTLSFGRRLFGYRIGDDGRRQVCDEDRSVVEEMFAAVVAGESLRSIAANLTERGVHTPNGHCIWWPYSIKSIINNPAYCGRTVVFRYKHDVRYVDGRRVHNGSAKGDPSQVVHLPGVTPAIVSEEVWESAQLAIASRYKKSGRRAVKEHLLRGFVRCATCGRQFSPVGKKGYTYYVCTSTQTQHTNCRTKSFPAVKAENYVWEKVREVLTKQNYKVPKATPTDDAGSVIERSQERLRGEITRLVKRAATADDDLWTQFEKEITLKKAELERLELQRLSLVKKRSTTKIQTPLSILRKRVADRLDELPFTERVDLLKDLGLACTWDGETLKVTINAK